MESFELDWPQVRELFWHEESQKFLICGQEYTLQKIENIERWNGPFLSRNPVWSNDGTLIVSCKENGLNYKCDYSEAGDSKEEAEMFMGYFSFSIRK